MVYKNRQNLISAIFLVIAFSLAFFFGPFHQFQGMTLMPGDFGDSRLNNYFLENIFQFLVGGTNSLIHLNFFSPYRYVLGFSDNLFGASPIYLVSRALTGQSDTAFQIWFYFSYIANYIAAYFALRLLGLSPIASIVGAIIFTFSLPVSAKTLHAQLGYRFCAPLAIAYLYLFLQRADLRLFFYSLIWLIWGFYCSIYIGAFIALFLGLMTLIFLTLSILKKDEYSYIFKSKIKSAILRPSLIGLFTTVALVGLLGALFYPYLAVTSLYAFKRDYSEILIMLPRFQSYLLADLSPSWGMISGALDVGPIRHEQQLFIGIIPAILLIASIFLKCNKQNMLYLTMGLTVLLSVLITLNIDGQHSAWQFFSKLPLLNSLRAMGRFVLVLLFPIAYLCGTTIQYFEVLVKSRVRYIFGLLLLSLVIIETSSSNTYAAFPKTAWRDRIAAEELRLPKKIPNDAILFFSQKSDAPPVAELDAMWVSMMHSKATLNGYSGNFPPGYQYDFGSNCLELPKRILAFLSFTGQLESSKFFELVNRVVPIGFEGCNMEWMKSVSKITSTNKPYSADEFKGLSIHYQSSSVIDSGLRVYLEIRNNGPISIAGYSSSNNPISLSYRFLDKGGAPISNWDPRIPLLADVSKNGALNFSFDLSRENFRDIAFIEFSLVQERIFWSYELGVLPLKISWNRLTSHKNN